MLKWINDETEWTLHTLEAENGLADATPADIIACLKANPEAAAAVWQALTESQGIKATLTARAEQAELERDEARAALASVRKERDELDEKYTAACGVVAWRQAKVDDLTRALADADKHADDLTATVERAREAARLDRDAATKANDTAKRYQTERDAAVAREAQWERLARELSGGHGGLGDFREWCAQLKCDYDVECGVRSQREGEIAALRSRGGGNCGCRLLFPNEMGKISRPDPQAPATRAELEELRRRVERLEQLTGFAPKE